MKRVLAWLLMLLCLPMGVMAEENGFVRTASFAIPSAWGAQWAQLPLDERWFMEDENQYHHGLARISLAMAVSAFRGSGGQEDAPIRHFFAQLGFEGAYDPDHAGLPAVQTWDYPSPGEETIATAIAWRYLTCFEAPAPLIAVAVCGGNYGDEWANNLDFGQAGDHAGFEKAAGLVIDRLRQFEADNHLSEEHCLYWFSGFGRGGGVCQAAAKKLGEGRYYTFAAPNAVLRDGSAAAEGVFNIVSAADALCQLPPRDWGFARWGRTLYLPSFLDKNHDYAPLLAGYSAVFSQFSRRQDQAGDVSLAPMARAAAAAFARLGQSRGIFSREYAPLLFKTMTGKRLTAAESIRSLSLLNGLSSAARAAQASSSLPPFPGSLGVFSSRELSALYAQHDPAAYACWILSLPEGNVLLTSSLTLTNTP